MSLDGFRADYLERGLTPTLDSLARAGVRAQWMTPSFPSKTFPNHYTLVTGLLPDHHGVIANNMWDDSLGAFSMSNRAAVQDARWWGGEPIWVTAETQGRRASAFFWPGSEAPIMGVYPTHWMAFDDNFPGPARVDSVLAWLDVPDAERPAFSTLYYSDVDHAGHSLGPVAPGSDSAIARVDSMLALLTSGLQRRGLAGKVNLIVVADHGMSAVSRDRLIALDDYIPLDSVMVIDWNPVAMIQPRGSVESIYRALRGAHPNLHVYRKSELPAHFRFGTNPRIPDIVAIADDGWTITSRARFATFNRGGEHGFDQTTPSMRALFVASGPAFRQGVVVPPFSNIHVYELMTHITGLNPAPNDGSLDSVRVMLRQ
ncbi:MAG TPA: ectonucleotide pyrophosphatase/phosphodiesterase [Gemmatimonadales bacterium]|nr:ectonucleotide pyrophosphatase/phosphodiesterase [Gemmatimonadales bacterium]